MPYAGFHSLAYPGTDMMQWLITNTNFTFVGFYLAPAPSRPDSDWMDKYNTLAGLGWGFAPVYVGQQEASQPGSHILTAAQGTQDGQDAVNLMVNAGFPLNSVVYLDYEQGGPASTAALAYIGAWVDAVQFSALTYVPGIYCSYLTAPSILALRPDVYIWVYQLTSPAPGPNFPTADPMLSGVQSATAWHYAANTNVTFVGAPKPSLTIDLDSATVDDPCRAAYGGGPTVWELTGNRGTDPTIDFLGTTDSQPLVIKTAGAERLRIDRSGNVGIGTNSPSYPLHIRNGGNAQLILDPIGSTGGGGDEATIVLGPAPSGTNRDYASMIRSISNAYSDDVGRAFRLKSATHYD
jgi:hypothetical protein